MGWLQGNDSAWKLFFAPYHISLCGQTWLWVILELSIYPYGTEEVQTRAIMGVQTVLIIAGWLHDKDSAWKPLCAPYHT